MRCSSTRPICARSTTCRSASRRLPGTRFGSRLLGTFIGHRALAQRGWTDFQGVQRFDQFDERLSTLAFGLLVHDIGLAASAGAGCMGAENVQRAEHISRGSALFPAAGTPAAARSVIHGHHERWDGIGYPERKRQDAIQPNARIAAIADAYDALRCERRWTRAATDPRRRGDDRGWRRLAIRSRACRALPGARTALPCRP